MRQKFSGFVKPMAVVGLIAILLLMEPDYGTLLVLSCAVMGVLLLAGAPFTQYMVFGSALFLGLAILAVIEPYRIERIETIFNPWADRFGAGYQLTQALAFGRGGLFGMGLGNSVQKLFYLPEAHTDFVFAILAEELGLIGAMITVGFMIFIVWRGLLIGDMQSLAVGPCCLSRVWACTSYCASNTYQFSGQYRAGSYNGPNASAPELWRKFARDDCRKPGCYSACQCRQPS